MNLNIQFLLIRLENLVSTGKFLIFTKNGVARFNWKEIKKEFPGREKLQLLRFLDRSKCKRKFYENKLNLKNGLLKEICKTFNKYNVLKKDNGIPISEATTKNESVISGNHSSGILINSAKSLKILKKSNNEEQTSLPQVPLLPEIKVILEEAFYREAARLFDSDKEGVLMLNKERISCILYNLHFSNYFHAKAEEVRIKLANEPPNTSILDNFRLSYNEIDKKIAIVGKDKIDNLYEEQRSGFLSISEKNEAGLDKKKVVLKKKDIVDEKYTDVEVELIYNNDSLKDNSKDIKNETNKDSGTFSNYHLVRFTL